MDKEELKDILKEFASGIEGLDSDGYIEFRIASAKAISAIIKLFTKNKAWGGFMDKLREILEELYVSNPVGGVSNDNGSIDQAHSAILKLFKQEMLRLIGENKVAGMQLIAGSNMRFCDNDEEVAYTNGYNQAKAELRKKVEVDNG
jgi:hypothetical protein